MAEAFEGYRSFAPKDWRAPRTSAHAEALSRWLCDPGFWGELARDGQALIGHSAFIPAASHSYRAEPDPLLAHLAHLFLRTRYWGSGVAAELLSHAATAAQRRGFAVMRLFVPAGQARARRFYERERFSPMGAPFDPGLGMPVVEYRRTLRDG